MSDDVDSAEEGLNQGNSTFHKVCIRCWGSLISSRGSPTRQYVERNSSSLTKLWIGRVHSLGKELLHSCALRWDLNKKLCVKVLLHSALFLVFAS